MHKIETAKQTAPNNPYAYTVLQNLKDAGCPGEMIEEFQASEDEKKRIRLLSRHRKNLLEKLHQDEKQIDCLDYLLYRIQKRDQA